MKLNSDFEDYYDEALRAHPCEHTLVRRRDVGIHRSIGLAWLHELGWPTVPHGTTDNLYGLVGDRYHLVVSLDDFRHGPDADGNDPLVLLRPGHAAEHAPGATCSLFVPHLDRQGCVLSYTQLVVGDRCFQLEYRQRDTLGQSPQSWMSNRGSFDVRVVQELPSLGYVPLLPFPIWSVDYVQAASETGGILIPTAFDLNDAPVLAGTGIEEILGPETVVGLIARAAVHHAESSRREEREEG